MFRRGFSRQELVKALPANREARLPSDERTFPRSFQRLPGLLNIAGFRLIGVRGCYHWLDFAQRFRTFDPADGSDCTGKTLKSRSGGGERGRWLFLCAVARDFSPVTSVTLGLVTRPLQFIAD